MPADEETRKVVEGCLSFSHVDAPRFYPAEIRYYWLTRQPARNSRILGVDARRPLGLIVRPGPWASV